MERRAEECPLDEQQLTVENEYEAALLNLVEARHGLGAAEAALQAAVSIILGSLTRRDGEQVECREVCYFKFDNLFGLDRLTPVHSILRILNELGEF